MANANQDIIKKIAQELDCGYDCYFNATTKEIIAIPNFSPIWDEDEFQDAFRKELEKVNKQKAAFIKFEAPESFESFKIMERFVEQINDPQFQSELENVLQKRKPFQNFKHKIDHSSFRQEWFSFKQKELEKKVEKELKLRKPE